MLLNVLYTGSMTAKYQANLRRKALLMDAATTPTNSREATTSQQDGHQTLSDVFSDCQAGTLLGRA